MSNRESDLQLTRLYARLDDLCAVSERGEVAASSFLSPGELHYGKGYLISKGRSFCSWGGCPDAERQRIYLLPDYMEDMAGAVSDGATDLEGAFAEYGHDTEIRALRIVGSGYRRLTHRDFLGSMLGLGLERSVIGDIAVLSENGSEAVVLCDRTISAFLENELSCVANDKVRVTRLESGEWEMPPRRTEAIRDTVASARLDAVVAALCGLSRERARNTVESGLVELDFESEERPDRTVSEQSTLSVRGIGRFRVISLSDKTKKGRFRLEAEKYV